MFYRLSVKNVSQCIPKPKMTSLNVLGCPQPTRYLVYCCNPFYIHILTLFFRNDLLVYLNHWALIQQIAYLLQFLLYVSMMHWHKNMNIWNLLKGF